MDSKLATKIFHSLIDLMKLFIKKEIDNLYADVLTESLYYFKQEQLLDQVIPLALSFCKPTRLHLLSERRGEPDDAENSRAHAGPALEGPGRHAGLRSEGLESRDCLLSRPELRREEDRVLLLRARRRSVEQARGDEGGQLGGR